MKRRRPETLTQQENMMIGLSMKQAEKQLREGTAPAQTVCHFLKLGSTMAQLELESIRIENELKMEKIESSRAAREVMSNYSEALEAFKKYNGDFNDDSGEDPYE